MASSKILLLIALFAVFSLASAKSHYFRFGSNSSNNTNSTNYTAPAYPIYYGGLSNHSNHSNNTNSTNFTAPAYPIYYGGFSNHSNHSNNTNSTNFTAPAYPIYYEGLKNHSNHSNNTNSTASAAPSFITFPSTPFFSFPRVVESNNHSNHSNNTNSTCKHEIAGQTFDLCAFKHSLNASFYVEPYFAANFTFNLLNSSLYDCNGTSSNSWLTARNNYGQCVAVHDAPAITLARQGLKIDYKLEDGNGNVSVHLICNKTAPHTAHLDFNFNRTSNLSLVMTAQSYYGCPVVTPNNSNNSNSSNSSVYGFVRNFGRKFLEF